MRDLLRRSTGFLPEVVLVGIGVLLRVLVFLRFDPRWGYDAESHVANIEWFRDHGSGPPLAHNRVAYHPPLFYAFQALIQRAAGYAGVPLLSGWVSREPSPALLNLQLLPLVASLLWLVTVAVLLRLVFPARLALARWVALLLLAVLPAAVHAAAMISNESINILFAGLTLLAAFLLADRPLGAWRWAVAFGLGAALGCKLLSKVSALVLVATVLCTFALSLAWQRRGTIRAHAAPWILALATAFAIAGPTYVRAWAERGQLVSGPFDRPGKDRDQYLATGAEDKPPWARRSPGYFLGWDSGLFAWPFFPVGSQDGPRFWPVLVASTFVDHYNYGLGRDPEAGRLPDDLAVNGWRLRPVVLAAARVSFAAGCVIALGAALGFFSAVHSLWRRRDAGRLGLLALPPLALAGQIHFAIRYPVDAQGVVKGAYLLFASPPIAAVFGLVVAWAWRRRAGRPFALVTLLAVAAVFGYLVVCLAVAFGVRGFVFWSPPAR